MNDFKRYLEEQGLIPRNIKRMLKLLQDYLTWLPVQIEENVYGDLMDYIGHLQGEGKSIHHINRSLQTISHYYQYKELPNIALTTRVKGAIRQARMPAFKEEELEAIYEQFESTAQNHYKHSDQIILGLILYQGVELGDFMKLRLHDVDLEKGILQIRARGKRNSRKVPLRSKQIMAIHRFIQEHRGEESEKLFSPQADREHLLTVQYKQLSKAVKRQSLEQLNLRVGRLHHLRQSRVSIWVAEEGLRKAQYLAGFRRVLSAERYRQADLRDLKEQVRLHHPL